MITTIAIFAVLNVLLAFIDSRLIGKGRRVLHGLNALIYLAMVYIPVWLFNNYWLIGCMLATRLVVFNISLNLFRGFTWNYISPSPAAITDKLAKAIFGKRGTLMYFSYFVLLILLIYLLWLHLSNA